MAGNDRTVKAFDNDLDALKSAVSAMGGLVESQVADCVRAVVRRDTELANRTCELDERIDEMEIQIQDLSQRILALRSPVASDLRAILGALRIAGDLERMGDHAKNIAKRATVLAAIPDPRGINGVLRMARLARTLIKEVLDSYVAGNAEAARKAWHRDEEIDEMHTSLFREYLTYMMEEPRNISACTHLLFVAKNIERIGDHATNIAETVHFIEAGQRLADSRPTGDDASFTFLDTDGRERVA